MKIKLKAFTLIELLVVISIIALLAALAIPALAKAMEKSKAIADASNMRQLGIGIMAYLGDSDQVLPKKDSADANSLSWPQTLQAKYVTDWKAFRSPFDKRTTAGADAASQPVSYGLNNNALTTTYVDMSKWKSPSTTILVAPNWDGTNFTGVSGQDVAVTAGSLKPTHQRKDPNTGMVGLLFGDMHVEASVRVVLVTGTAANTSKWDPSK